MATDPAVQAANALAQNMGSGVGWQHWLPLAEVVVAAVTPLIRAQAFTEAADAIEAEAEKVRIAQLGLKTYAIYRTIAALVRGLSEETENA
jgi:hypothetical protein